MTLPELSLRELLAVVAVADHGHFGHAAASLHTAQPTLTAQVQKVERLLRVRLFDRTPRSFQITPDGARLLPLLRDLLAGAERLHAAAADHTGISTPLRLGIIPTLGPYLVPHILIPHSRNQACPNLAISERLTASLVAGLIDGTLDAAILSLPIRHESLACIPLFDEPFRLIAPRHSGILEQRQLSPTRLCATDMVLLEEGHCLRDQALSLCGGRRSGSPRLVAISLETLKWVVGAGGGYSLLPQLANDIPSALAPLVTVRRFDEGAPSRRIGLVARHSSTRRADVEALATHIRARLPEGVQPAPASPKSHRVRAARRLS